MPALSAAFKGGLGFARPQKTKQIRAPYQGLCGLISKILVLIN